MVRFETAKEKKIMKLVKQIDLNENPGDLYAILAVTDYSCGAYDGYGEAIALEDDSGQLVVRVYNLSHCSCFGPLENAAIESCTLTEYQEKRDNVLGSIASSTVRAEFDKLLDQYLTTNWFNSTSVTEKSDKINKLVKEMGMQCALEGLIATVKDQDEDYCKKLLIDLTHAYNNYMRRYETNPES
jgi:hypothetical protein